MAPWFGVATIISNYAFFFPSTAAVRRDLWLIVMCCAFIMICSSMYHACNTFSGYCSGLGPHVLRANDFFFAQFVIPLIAMQAIHFPRKTMWWAKGVLLISVAFGIYLSLLYWGDSFHVQIAIAMASFGSILLYWCIYAAHRSSQGKTHRLLPSYRWDNFALGIGMSGMACALFAIEMLDHRFYWAIHSVWHIDAALGLYFLINIWPEDNKYVQEQRASYTQLNSKTVAHLTPAARAVNIQKRL